MLVTLKWHIFNASTKNAIFLPLGKKYFGGKNEHLNNNIKVSK